MSKMDTIPASALNDFAADAENLTRGRIPDRWRTEVERLGRSLARSSPIATPFFAEELIAAGLVALWRAGEVFDASRGAPFEHYARRSIRNAMLNELRALEQPTSRAMAIPLDADAIPPHLLASSTDGPERICERNEVRVTVRDWIGTCETALREVFGLLYERDLTQREAAAEMGLSQPRVSQYHTRLIENGREALASLAAA